MTMISDIFRTHGPEYLQKYGESMPSEHLKVLDAIMKCRSAAYGMVFYACDNCDEIHPVFRSCGNRHCPICQHHKTRQWLEKQLKKQLPGHHFMITFTVPEQIRGFIRSHQRICYNAMFKASSEAMKALAADERHIGGDLPGFQGVLHTWGRQMPYNPHVHYVVPGGAISKSDGTWRPSRKDFYVPVKPLSIIYTAKFKDEMKKAGLLDKIPPEVWDIKWNVNIQAVGNSENTIAYLAPYVFKVAISNSRIVKVEDGMVTFKYRKQRSNRWRTVTVDAMEFIRRFLQHVLPTGFMKVRYYGFLHPGCSIPIEDVSAKIQVANEFDIEVPKRELVPLPKPVCPVCGCELRYLYSIFPHEMNMEWFRKGVG